MRANETARVASLLDQAEAMRPKLSGTADGVAFDDWRDVDDRSAWFLEVLSHDGGYLWVDTASVAGLRFTPATRPIDLLWREARMSLHDGRVAEIVLPAQYAGVAPDPAQRLARRTDWQKFPGGAWIGTGQRVWLLGEAAQGLLDLGEITLTGAP
jgi:type VI secretion system protein ImpE